MSSAMSRRSILSMLSTALFRSSITGLMVCLRAKASNCRVRSAERVAALKISSRSACSGSAGSTLFRASSA